MKASRHSRVRWTLSPYLKDDQTPLQILNSKPTEVDLIGYFYQLNPHLHPRFTKATISPFAFSKYIYKVTIEVNSRPVSHLVLAPTEI